MVPDKSSRAVSYAWRQKIEQPPKKDKQSEVMTFRMLARRFLFAVFCLSVALTIALHFLFNWLVKVLDVFGAVYATWGTMMWAIYVAPVLILSFIGWALLTEFRPRIKALLVALALASCGLDSFGFPLF